MLNKPKFMSPSINMYGNTVIDLNSDALPFSCIVDGNEVITDFQIVISRLKDNEIVFDTGMHTLETPFAPVNNRNQNVVFTIDLKQYFDIARICYVKNDNKTYDSNKVYYVKKNNKYSVYEYTTETAWSSDYSSLYYTNFINSTDAYYWAITLRNDKSGTETYSVGEVFYANSVPETAIYYNEIDGDDENFIHLSNTDIIYTFSKRKIYFKSTYNQSEKIPLKRYGWRLTDATNNAVIMDTISQNQIYGMTNDISCVCNGLINQISYLLELYVETQNGYFDILQSVNFKVDYEVKSVDADFEITALNNIGGIMLNWGNLRTTEGVVIGDGVNYIEDFPVSSTTSLEIPDDIEVVFSNKSSIKQLEIDENSYVVISFQFDKKQSNKLFEMSGLDEFSNNITRSLEYDASTGNLKYTIVKGDTGVSYDKTLTKNSLADELCWYVVVLYPLINDSAYYKIVESVSDNNLFVDDNLYPEEDLFPYFGKWDKVRSGVV